MRAKLIPWSSIVGTGVMLLDGTGRCIGQLALHNVALADGEDRKAVMMFIAQNVADAINDADATA